MTALDTTVHLTLDIDWAHDDVLRDTLALLDRLAVPAATFFATHATPVLAEIRRRGHELGIHPNLRHLETGDAGESAAKAVERLKGIVPEAVSVRCHGLTRGNALSAVFLAGGMTHEANLMVPVGAARRLAPWEQPAGLVQVPHNWGDYAHCDARSGLTPEQYLAAEGLKVLNFHPIHLFLNTAELGMYHRAKPYAGDVEHLRSLRHEGPGGVRHWLEAIVRGAHERGYAFAHVRDVRPMPDGD